MSFDFQEKLKAFPEILGKHFSVFLIFGGKNKIP